MAKIFPFRGITYNPEKIDDLDKVVTQPYDRIDPEAQDDYYDRHPNNVCQLIKGKDQDGDNEGGPNKYTRANDFMKEWLDKGILELDDKPAIYAYHQTYKSLEGDLVTRKGFCCNLQLQDYKKGGLMPHEQTLAKPKKDRFALLKATDTLFGQIFMLYSDPEDAVTKALEVLTVDEPDIEAKDDFGNIHQMWKIMQPGAILEVQRIMEDKGVFIADGHHRYETSLNYREEMRKQGKKCGELNTYENTMVTLINMEDKGLTILPTHRLIHSLDYNPKNLLPQLSEYFEITQHPASERDKFFDLLAERGAKQCCFGLYPGGATIHLLALKDIEKAEKLLPSDHSEAWRKLDVVILHSVILDHLLGIDAKKLEEQTNVNYIKDRNQALDKVTKGDFQMVFLMNPTKIEQVRNVAMNMEKMPQKSTDFYPKLLSGLVMCPILFTE